MKKVSIKIVLENRRSRIARPLPGLPRPKASTSNSQVGAVSMVTVFSSLSRVNQVPVMNFPMR